VRDSKRWFPGHTNDSLPHHTLALAGEVGEFANWIKKVERGDVDLHDALTQHELRGELADIFIYVLQIAGMLKIDLYKAYCEKRAINEKRWGNT
jgi:NTP pyrophosphatase (non-canonical NTP hydrolase)